MSGYQRILLETRDSLQIIRFNRPKIKNAWDRITYEEITRALIEANRDPAISTVALTGIGDFYSSGNDMKAAFESNLNSDNPEVVIKSSHDALVNLVDAFICFEKLLIAVVNGPCLGIAATTAALCDLIYVTKSAYFHTPFTSLALCAEGCSSVTFPKIFGTAKAAELLLLSEKLSAEEALQYGFVNRVFADQQEMDRIVWPLIATYSKLSTASLMATKALIRKFDMKELKEVNRLEVEQLKVRMSSGEVVEAAMKFLTRKNKL